MKKTLVVLAAGMGSRYGGLKQIDPVGPSNETIIDYSIYDAIKAGFDHVVFIIREDFYNDFKSSIGNYVESIVSVSYVFQDNCNIPDGFKLDDNRKKPLGTGHALYCAINDIKTPFLIINGDDFYGRNAFQIVSNYMDSITKEKKYGGMVSYFLKNTLSENGTVSRGICSQNNDNLIDVVETHNIVFDSDNDEITSDNGELAPEAITSMNLWFFTPDIFTHVKRYFIEFLQLNCNSLKSEFYLPYIVNRLIEESVLDIDILYTEDKWYGVTYQEDKDSVTNAISKMVESNIYPHCLKEVFNV